MGLVISTFGDNLREQLPACLPLLVDRMGNEIIRLTAVKAFAVIATSPLKVHLSCVLDHVIAELTAFLRKANRALRQATLGTLNSLISAYGDSIDSSAYEKLSNFISACTGTLLHLDGDNRSSRNFGLAVAERVLPQALTLIKSSLLQRQGLSPLQNFFAALVYSANSSFDSLLESLLSSAKPYPQSGAIVKQALYSIAQCVAVLCLAAGDQKCSSTMKMLTDILRDDTSTNSEIKSAASYALGNIAVGNLTKYLPFILDQIDNQQKKQYLLLHSLKEVILIRIKFIVQHSVDKAEFDDASVDKILKLLFNHCESEEEGVRNVVAECLGKLSLIEPMKLVPALKVWTTSAAGFTRSTVVTAVKYSMMERPGKIDEIYILRSHHF
ncbi:hypothetical protein MLD38_013325 [Melastoma candidum]|uniref:Uncharacterized protein n=1 Tax=Melastoma candidum TaxID=119954 RepID=A0ACB9RAC4_9MYRT|nr:hypothetical protein MLD38_013325 [Melastoma candidum]